MKEINIGIVITNKRKEKGVTQEELAEFIKVSKAAVSKWETGQSYPDIVLLPSLATYFNISIDELIGYMPQMTDSDIKRMYTRFIKQFSENPFNEVYSECMAIKDKYYSCFPLLFKISLLLINHYCLAPDKERGIEALKEAAVLSRRVKAETEDIKLAREANSIEAISFLIMGEADKVIELIDGEMKPEMETDTILSSAYTMKGDLARARELLQINAYKHLVSLASVFPQYIGIFPDEPDKFKLALDRILGFTEAFKLDKLHPNSAMQIYYSLALRYAGQKNSEACLQMLERYAGAIDYLLPFTLKGDEFFNLIDGWLKELDFSENAPREGGVIIRSILDSLENNPQFDIIRKDIRYVNIINKIERLKEKL